jgi:hypothetical protein
MIAEPVARQRVLGSDVCAVCHDAAWAHGVKGVAAIVDAVYATRP